MNTVGKFHITDTFTNKDIRGIIIGNLLEGTTAVGNFISFMTKTGETALTYFRDRKGENNIGYFFHRFTY